MKNLSAPQSQKPVLSFAETAALLGYSTASAGFVSRQRGIFPVRVRQIGKKLVCFRTDLDQFLSDGISQAPASVPALKKTVAAKKTGRPRKTETLEAARLGLSVAELRAQAKAGVQS